MTYGLGADMWAFGILVGQLVTVDLLYPYGAGLTWRNVHNQVRWHAGGIRYEAKKSQIMCAD